MTELRTSLTQQLPKLQNLRTYIQTGNLIYEVEDKDKDTNYWSTQIEAALETIYGC